MTGSQHVTEALRFIVQSWHSFDVSRWRVSFSTILQYFAIFCHILPYFSCLSMNFFLSKLFFSAGILPCWNTAPNQNLIFVKHLKSLLKNTVYSQNIPIYPQRWDHRGGSYWGMVIVLGWPPWLAICLVVLEHGWNIGISWDLIGIYSHYKWYIISGWWWLEHGWIIFFHFI